MFYKKFVFVLLFSISAITLCGVGADSNGRINGRIKLFIEGDLISYSYIQESINFVDFVNDAFSSDVHIIVKRLNTGSGGSNYTLSFYSRTFTTIGNATLSALVLPVDTKDDARKILVQTIKLGLMPYLSQTSNSGYIDIRNKMKKTQDTLASNIISDPWKQWVFRTDLTGRLDIEEMKETYAYRTNLRADKVTNIWRIRNNFTYDNQLRRIYKNTTDNGSVTKTATDYVNVYTALNSSLVFSITDHWSAGAFADYSESTYRNIDQSISFSPAIEYNIFPWKEQSNRSFTLAYYAGTGIQWYNEVNTLGDMSSRIISHSFLVRTEFTKPWGDFLASLSGNQFLTATEMYSLNFNTNLSVRIFKGLSVNFGFEASSVHDQIYLPRSTASIEDILSNTRKLPSSFEFNSNMGLRFQFGSIYNSVVNTRL